MTARRDYIAATEFLATTREGMRLVSERYDLWDIDDLRTPEDWAALFFILRKVPDCPELFPSGKWAAIQALEQKLDEWADGRLAGK